MKTTALILAAGRSSRMGGLKPVLPLGDTTFIGQQIRTFRECGVEDFVIVTGREPDRIQNACPGEGITFVHNPDFEINQMIDSIKIGLKALGDHPKNVFIIPADIPLFTTYTVNALLQCAKDHTYASIFVPVYKFKQGHPVFICEKRIRDLYHYDLEDGLKGFLNLHDTEVIRTHVPDPAVRMDADDPEEYEALKKYMSERPIPDEKRIQELEEFFALPSLVIEHEKAVAKLVMEWADILEIRGKAVHRETLYAAARLHDIARLHSDHDRYGAGLLQSLGHTAVVEMVRDHMHPIVGDPHLFQEKDLIFLADKYTAGTSRVTLLDRYAKKLDKFNDKLSRDLVQKRLSEAEIIEKRVKEYIYGKI